MFLKTYLYLSTIQFIVRNQVGYIDNQENEMSSWERHTVLNGTSSHSDQVNSVSVDSNAAGEVLFFSSLFLRILSAFLS